MREVPNQISAAECQQLNGQVSEAVEPEAVDQSPCEGCPVYELAKSTMEVSELNDGVALELAKKCPVGASMDLESLGIRVVSSTEPREHSRYFVRQAGI